MIRQIEISELNKLARIAKAFTETSKYVNVDIDYFVKSWTNFINIEMGVIFVSEQNNEFAGAIGALAYRDPNNGKLVASEMFWFVHPEYRGCGIKLLKTFEKWGKGRDCDQFMMCHMVDSMPEKVKKVYLRMGYEQMEEHYVKEN